MESTSNGSTPIFDYLRRYKFKKVVLCNDTDIGLRAVIAIHSTALGPAAGGLRMWTYASEEEAIMDALRLARGMTYKYAAAGVNLGGGKAVCDAVYLPGAETALIRAARQRGARVVTGERMLLYQGVEAQRLWTGREPNVKAMSDAISS